MKTSTILSASLLAVGLASGTGVARADTTEASCEVRKDGDKQKGKSGPCSFSQRQGFIDLDLRNGDTIVLSPAGGGGQYRDQNGNKVTRTSAGGSGLSLRWANGKRIDVTWQGNHHGSPSYGTSGNYGAYGNRSSEYQRGYDDGLRGDWDTERHNQEYKDGYSAGESARGGGQGGRHAGHKGGSGGQNYGINRLDNGEFEVVSSNPFCTVLFNKHGEPKRYGADCTPEQRQKSYEYAQRER